jgi:hypothetical protein
MADTNPEEQNEPMDADLSSDDDFSDDEDDEQDYMDDGKIDRLEAKVFRVHSCFSYIFLVDGNAIF